jgi:hypothetical protein
MYAYIEILIRIINAHIDAVQKDAKQSDQGKI